MAVYMPPLARKKRVPQQIKPDTFRVISIEAEESHPKFPNSTFHGIGRRPWSRSNTLPNIPGARETRVLPHVMPDYRANKPQPTSCHFLTHNVRLLNEPVCSVVTATTRNEQPYWWHYERPVDVSTRPDYSLDTLYRNDFQYNNELWPPASSRYSSNPKHDPAYGIVPVNQLGGRKHKHRLFREKISYEHEFNSRKDPSYPIRSRRQGNFVWNEMKPDKLQEFIDYHLSLNQGDCQPISTQQQTAPPTLGYNAMETLPSGMVEPCGDLLGTKTGESAGVSVETRSEQVPLQVREESCEERERHQLAPLVNLSQQQDE